MIIHENTIESIINEFVRKLSDDLSKLELNLLTRKLEDIQQDFHIHSFKNSQALKEVKVLFL